MSKKKNKTKQDTIKNWPVVINPHFLFLKLCNNSRYDGIYAARYTLNSCLVGVVIVLPQKISDESNGALVDNTEGLSCFGIRDYLGNYCPSLP